MTFYLKAQLDPRQNTLYANLQDKTSVLRTDYALYLYNPGVPASEESKLGNPAGSIQLQKQLTVKVGGIAGLRASEAKAAIKLDKLRFSPGEKIRVHISMDNSNCRKAVKSYKLKLRRRIQCFAGGKGPQATQAIFDNEDLLLAIKYQGLAEKKKEERTIEF